MSGELSNEAQELVQQGQLALRPTASDKQRIFEALQARIQAESTGESSAPSARETDSRGEAEVPVPNASVSDAGAGSRFSAGTLGKFALVAGGLIATFAVISNYDADKGDAPLPPVAASSVEPTPSVEQDRQTAGPISGNQQSAALAPSGKPTNRSPAEDSLAAEAALLSKAEKALHSGDLGRALVLTNEHRKRFPKGVMLRERVNIRVHALCGLGRDQEADKEYARIRRDSDSKPGHACRR